METLDRLIFRVLLFALALVGCTDSNAPGGGWTQREEAEHVGRAFCTLLVKCSPPSATTIDSCTVMYVEGVCSIEGFDCNSPADNFGDCEDALIDHTCVPGMPDSCTGILR